MVVFHVPVFALSLQHFYRTLTGYTTAMLIHNAMHMMAFRYEENIFVDKMFQKSLIESQYAGLSHWPQDTS